MNAEPVIQFDNVHRAYRRGVDVLNGISFSIEPGQVVGLLGKNGAGKTTLIRIAMGMIEAQEGSIRLFGLDPRRDPVEIKRRVGYVSEDQILPPFLRVGEVLRIYRELYPTWDRQTELALLDRFELSRGARIRHLSKGQARRVSLVCAVAHRPPLLLLDEPAGGLDPAARQEFLEIVVQLLNESESTILFSSHHMTDVERMADRVVLIQQGRILIDSELDVLREAHCLALVPRGPGVARDRLLALGECLGVREREDSLHAVLRLEPEAACSMLQQTLGIDVRCTRLGLEEMFVELVGGQP
jgi:ABC-2 type transport system ATP-binding protein